MESLRSHISAREMGNLFSAPHVTVLLLWACQGTDYSPQDLQKIILQDSALCSKILTTASKTSPENIDPSAPLTSSLKVLNLPIIKSLAIQSAKRIVESELGPAEVQFMRELWFYSQVGCIVSRSLAEQIAYPDPEEAQVTGLLMNIGMLAAFSNDPERYIVTAGGSLSCREVADREQTGYEIDHLQTADALVSGWQLESFMADAISFLHLDLDQCRGASPLIRMARLALEFCRSPLELDNGMLHAADRLFDFTTAETEKLFKAAADQYRSLSPLDGEPQEGFAEFQKGQKRLTSVVFSIAGQDGVCSRVVDAISLEDFVESARHLYLHNSAAQEAIFFSYDARDSMLSGLRAKKQHRLIGELTTTLGGESLLAEALKVGKVRHSFNKKNSELSIFDRQLSRVCKSAGIVCLPLAVEGKLVGGVVLGVESAYEAEFFTEPQARMLSGSVARALSSLLSFEYGPPVHARGKDPSLVIPKLIHEISSPLAIINNYMAAVGSVADDGKRQEVFAAIDNEVKRIGKILTYYGSSDEVVPASEARVDLNQLLQSALDSLALTYFQPKNIEVITELDGSVRPVRSKSVAITQILVNLLKNAAEALAEGGRVTLTTREVMTSGGRVFVELCIHDNGPGIDKEIQRQLFSPLKSTKGAGHAGLGLSIVKEMANDIEAEISCHSSAEHGTSFNLLIPVGPG